MKVLTLHPLEYCASELSIDTKLDDIKLDDEKRGYEGVLTSESVRIEAVYDSILSPIATLVDGHGQQQQQHHMYPIQAIDVNKHRIMHLQRYKHVLRLVMLCTTACWAALTVVFTLLIVHQIVMDDSSMDRTRSPNYMVIFEMAMAGISVGWFLSGMACIWRYRKYKRWLNLTDTTAEWVVAGKPRTDSPATQHTVYIPSYGITRGRPSLI